MLRRKLTLAAIVSLVTLASACAGITSPRDGDDDTGRCQVTSGSNTRCTDTLPN